MYKHFSKIYDNFMQYADYTKWKEEIEKLILLGQPKGKELLELGCGTGELLKRFEKDYHCHGLDISEHMLKVAQEKLVAQKIPLYLGDMVDFDTGDRYDIIIAIFDTVNHIVDMIDLKRHFRTVFANLKPGGVYIFDIVDRAFMDEMFPNDVFVDVRDDLTVIWEHELEDGIDYIDATYFTHLVGSRYRRVEESYAKKIYHRRELEHAIRRSNLKIQKVVTSTGIAGNRYMYLLKKEEL